MIIGFSPAWVSLSPRGSLSPANVTSRPTEEKKPPVLPAGYRSSSSWNWQSTAKRWGRPEQASLVTLGPLETDSVELVVKTMILIGLMTCLLLSVTQLISGAKTATVMATRGSSRIRKLMAALRHPNPTIRAGRAQVLVRTAERTDEVALRGEIREALRRVRRSEDDSRVIQLIDAHLTIPQPKAVRPPRPPRLPRPPRPPRPKKIRTEPARVDAAFDTALHELRDQIRQAAKGKWPIRPQTIAERACQIYNRDLPPTHIRAGLGTFRGYVSGKMTRPHLVQRLEAAGVRKQFHALVDKEKRNAAFERAITELRRERKPFYQQTVARRAYEIYCEQLPKGAPQPGLDAFLNYVEKRHSDGAIRKLLARRGVPRQEQAGNIDRPRLLTAFERAIREFTKRDDSRPPVFHQTVAQRAHEIYTATPNGARQPTFSAFRAMVAGKDADQEIIALLTKAGIVRQNRNVVDNAKVARCFRDAAVSQRGGSLNQIALEAWREYCRKIRPTERPSCYTFKGFIMGARARPDILKLVQTA